MSKIVPLVVVVGAFVALSIIQSIAAEPKAPITKPPNVASPPANTTPPAAPKTSGFVTQGNQLLPLPGYELQSGPNNQVIARKSGGTGGGLGDVAASCSCRNGSGTCTVVTTTHGSTCDKGEKGTCTGSCEYMPGTGTGFTGARMQ